MKIVNYVFTLVFLTIIVLPLVFMDTKSAISENENRTLAAFPDVITGGITQFPKSLDNYISDRFGFKNESVAFINSITMYNNFIKGNVVLGKDDWLFFSNKGSNINDFLKINLFSQDEIKQIITNIEDRLEWCNDNSIKFIFLMAPNKHTIYPEQYPIKRPEGITRTEQIMDAMTDNLKDVVIYPRDYILSKKAKPIPAYFETDSHWNMLGASYAYNLIFEKIKNKFPNTIFPDIEFITDVTYDSLGDLVPLSGFTSYGKRTIPDIHPEKGWPAYYAYIKNDGRNCAIENKNQSLPKAIIFHDSFFPTLEPFTSTLFSSAEYNWRWFTENEKESILQNKPDIIIWEVVERAIDGILYFPWN
jgi:hypothetical protein